MEILVAKLSYDTQTDDLRDLFRQYGEVDSVKLITDRDTGRSKGFGFIEMPNDDEAYQAISDLNQSVLDGRNIVVKKSDKGYSNKRGGGFNRGGGNRDNRGGGGGGYNGGYDRRY